VNQPKYMRAALRRSIAALRELQQTRPLQLADLRTEAKTCGSPSS
jgi:hypothetical protein